VSDIFQEVEEDIRRERYEKLWKKYGPYVIGGVVALLLGMVGWQQWKAYQEREREKHAAAYFEAALLLEEGNDAAAAEAFAELAGSAGSGYRAVARLRQAEALLQQGQPEQALAVYDALAADSGVNRMMRDLAALKGALLVADSTTPAAMRERLKGALRPDSPWRHVAQELVAYSLYRTGDLEAARSEYQSLVNEFAAPSHIRARGREMVALIDSERPPQADESAADEDAADGAQPGEESDGEDAVAGGADVSDDESAGGEDGPAENEPAIQDDDTAQPSEAGDEKASGGPSGG
jgi:hypothetical protein